MRNVALLVSLCVISTGVMAANRAIAPTTIDATFQHMGSQFIQAGKTDALSIAVVDHGKPRFYNFGSTSPDASTPPTENTAYEIGSITKLFTSLLLAHAIVDGNARATDDLRSYLPGSYANLQRDGVPIRLVDLADTTSALPDNLPDFTKLAPTPSPEKPPFAATKQLADYDRAQLFEDLKTASLSSRPGSVPKHSNLASVLLAIAVEKSYGQDFASLLARFIEKPFGMQAGLSKGRAGQFATGYTADHVAMPALDAPYIAAAAGLRYSARDMSRFLIAELAAKDPAIRLSQKVAWGDIDEDATAFNWKVDRTIDGQRRLRASGGTFAFSSYIELYPDSGYGVVLLANRPGQTQAELKAFAEEAIVDMRGKPAAQVALEDSLEKADFREAARVIAQVKHTYPNLNLPEERINSWGYSLFRAGKTEQAVSLFVYNTERHPQSWNAWDSLGEAYEKANARDKAIASYRRSLELNPDNAHATEQLKLMASSPG
ncbi:CubicO group peptidase (beta-lactamase class C family) [Luteibacter sp. OK325]|uniref:serine hydrolase n=1 Tax=Luteibacter sp. OK325 TaxID=2135670 RepID=UPI000D3B6848|nr:serine hydrolase [Luteibacter sp. OK325]PTR30862.1 CubicO group peptidase (beta-lactamase class C family) [Luteibacter sp. OK325]